MKINIEDQFYGSFKDTLETARDVQFEQMSKSGNAIRESIRNRLSSTTTNYVTRVSKKGRPYLQKTGAREYGLRESTSIDQYTANPPSMKNLVTSFLMEKSGILVVGGANPRFRPIIRRNGEPVGVGATQPAVSQQTVSILHRMDIGEENSYYPTHSKLAPSIKGTGFMRSGISSAEGKVRAYLTEGYFKVIRQAEKKPKTKKWSA